MLELLAAIGLALLVVVFFGFSHCYRFSSEELTAIFQDFHPLIKAVLWILSAVVAIAVISKFDSTYLIIIGIILFLCLVLLILGLCYRVFCSRKIKERENNLEQKFQIIVHPTDSCQVGFKINKIIAISYLQAKYKYDIPMEKAVSYYEEELVKLGWLKRAKKTNWSGNPELVFEEGLYRLKINFIKQKEGYYCNFRLEYNDLWGKLTI